MKQGAKAWALGALIVLMFGSGCEDAVIDPFENEDKYFTIYGYLDHWKNFQPGARQWIRVVPVTRRPEEITSPESPQADLDARVYLTDLEDSVTTELLYELREFQPGSYGHLFSTAFFIKPNHTYRLEVIRKDGSMTTAETKVPHLSGIFVEQEPLQINADSTDIRQTILLTDVNALWDTKIIYRISTGTCFSASAIDISYGRRGQATAAGWEIDLDIAQDFREALNRLNVPEATLCAMGIRVKITDDQWILPEGELNYDNISLPQQLTNVTNGYGFLGALGLYQFDWQIGEELNEMLSSF